MFLTLMLTENAPNFINIFLFLSLFINVNSTLFVGIIT